MEIFVWRALERILIVLVGGLSIYLGYRLFSSIKAGGEGAAEIRLPGNVTLMVSRVGPGVFFALFGALVVAASLAFPIHYSEQQRQAAGGSELISRSISGIGPGAVSELNAGNGGQLAMAADTAASLQLQRLRVREHVAFLNQLPGLLAPDLTPQQRKRARDRLLAGKLQLMQGVWAEDWGDFEQFRLWAESGSPAGHSAEFQRARTFFDHGEPQP